MGVGMGRPLVITAKEGYAVEQLLKLVDALAITWMMEQGHKQDEDGFIVCKNHGVDDFEAVRTKTWANIQTAVDGTEYFTSLSNDPRFKNWKDYWIAAGFPENYEEIERPNEWAIEEIEL